MNRLCDTTNENINYKFTVNLSIDERLELESICFYLKFNKTSFLKEIIKTKYNEVMTVAESVRENDEFFRNTK